MRINWKKIYKKFWLYAMDGDWDKFNLYSDQIYCLITGRKKYWRIMSKYQNMDVPFCVRCSRFMVIKVGKIWVALNHVGDKDLMIRSGIAYRCPECAAISIYKWEDCFKVEHKNLEEVWDYWFIYLEDHKHFNKYKAKKELTPTHDK
ncbi:MAG: hypothetical protein ACFFAO_06410 [Candidatus Hermodarchaeota archaeon]